jgi:hypothetical protein
MSTWNLHVVANDPIEDVHAIAQDIADAVTSKGHELVQVVLTTDEGSQDITPAPTPPPEPPVPEPAPVETQVEPVA